MSNRSSKFLSLVLRHEPERIGIVLDDAGWTDVATLLYAAASHGVAITRAELDQIVATSYKQRFALSPDGTRIRANQGHSIEVDLQLAPVTPPDVLYHGTSYAALPSIHAQGLTPRARHHVHLSADPATATSVGSRHGKPVVLTIRAAQLAATGAPFYRTANGVWLADAVPVEFIEFPATREHGRTSDPPRAKIARDTLAACDAGSYVNARGQTVELAAAIAAATSGTVMIELGDELDKALARPATAISVTGETTIEALVRLAPASGHLGCLNFASARNPGGGFLGGAQAQEESLARSSALYPCQLTQPQFYQSNRAQKSLLYLDQAIYSPLVPFFRDDRGGWLDAPVLASVITCPAPNAGALRRDSDVAALEQTLRRRAAFVLDIARHHAIDRLVLGAWGAGVFGNDPVMVANAFAMLLGSSHSGAFDEVVFAVLGETSANHRAFAKKFR